MKKLFFFLVFIFFIKLFTPEIALANCTIFEVTPSLGNLDTNFAIRGEGCDPQTYKVSSFNPGFGYLERERSVIPDEKGDLSTFMSGLGTGIHNIFIFNEDGSWASSPIQIQILDATIKNCNESVVENEVCPPECPKTNEAGSNTSFICKPINPYPQVSCNGDKGLSTAIGCVPIGVIDFAASAVIFSLATGSGIAFLLMIFAIFKITTSQGNIDQVADARQMFTAAISGLLIIILSVFLLRLIGVNILGLF